MVEEPGVLEGGDGVGLAPHRQHRLVRRVLWAVLIPKRSLAIAHLTIAELGRPLPPIGSWPCRIVAQAMPSADAASPPILYQTGLGTLTYGLRTASRIHTPEDWTYNGAYTGRASVARVVDAPGAG